MLRETAERVHRSTGGSVRVAGVAVGVLVGLVGVPVLLLAEFNVGVLSAVGAGDMRTLGLLGLLPGFLLGGLSLVAMLGS